MLSFIVVIFYERGVFRGCVVVKILEMVLFPQQLWY